MSGAAAATPAIISASLNADVPADHGAWFMRRVAEGYCRIGRRDGIHYRKVSLARDAVAGFVFWTRNVVPFLPCLTALRGRGYPSIVQFAVTDYPAAVDPARIIGSAAIDGFRAVVGILGERAVVWRYDPIVIDASMSSAWHVDHFAGIATQLRGLTNEVAIAFAREPKRTPPAAHPVPTSDDDRRNLVRALAASAKSCGMRLTLCSQPDWLAPGAAPARCIDARRLADVGAGDLAVGTAGFVPGCLCARAIELGDSEGARPHFAGAVPPRSRGRSLDPGRELLIPPRRVFVRMDAAGLPF